MSQIKVFISYRNVEPSRDYARVLATELAARGYEVFFDSDNLNPGDEWAGKIYQNIGESDVLCLLLQPETADSVWVQREVDMARGAHVQILPLQVSAGVLDQAVLDKLAITQTQFVHYDAAKTDYGLIAASIEELSKRTRDSQKAWISVLESKRRPTAAKNNPSFAKYRAAQEAHPCEIHLATGDISELSGLDVIVNSMNDYMQMAHFYDTKTLSSSLRFAGAQKLPGGRILDTVQQEVNEHTVGFGLPVEMREVVITHAGHPKSRLIKTTGARYIFHVATSQVNIKTFTEKITPITSDDGLREVVRHCLDQVMEVDSVQGVISSETGARHAEEMQLAAAYQPIRSIIFPMFGTGQGGRAIATVTPPMVEAIRDFLIDHRADQQLHLERIHLGVYPESGVAWVKAAMDRLLLPIGE